MDGIVDLIGVNGCDNSVLFYLVQSITQSGFDSRAPTNS